MERLRRLWAFVVRWARRIADVVPPTPLALAVAIGCSVAVFYYGLERIDLVLLVIGVVGLGAVVISTLVVGITGLALWLSLRKRPTADGLKLECGQPTRTGFSIPSLWWVPLVRVRWKWTEPEALARTHAYKGRLWEEVLPMRRGIRDEVVRRFEVLDALGFAKVAFTLRESRAVKTTPTVGALRSMHVVRSMAGGSDFSHPEGAPEGERMDMRHYNPGDPIRYVLWKVFARSRELVVRTPERAISASRQTVAYVVAGSGDEPAAGAARVAMDTGALGSEWVLGADGANDYAKSMAHGVDVLAKSGDADAVAGGFGLDEFLRTATPASVGRAVVFVPGRPGPWLPRAIAAARARASTTGFSQVEFVVCTDGIERDVAQSKFGRWTKKQKVREPSAFQPTSAKDVAHVVDALVAARARVLVVDRVQGRIYTEQMRAKLGGGGS